MDWTSDGKKRMWSDCVIRELDFLLASIPKLYCMKR